MTTTAEGARYTIPDPAGVEDDATVELDLTAGDSEDAHRNVTSILVNGKVDLGIEQARKVAAQMIALCDSVTPASPDALGALGHLERARRIVRKGETADDNEWTPLAIASLMSETGKDFGELFDIVTL